MPSPQYFFGQSGDLIVVRLSSVVSVVSVVIIIDVHVEFQKFAIMLLQILVELGVLFGEFG